MRDTRYTNRRLYLFLYVTMHSDTSSPLHTLSDALKLIVHLQRLASHPQLIEPCDILSPFHMDGIDYHTARLVDFIHDVSRRDVRVSTCMFFVDFLL